MRVEYGVIAEDVEVAYRAAGRYCRAPFRFSAAAMLGNVLLWLFIGYAVSTLLDLHVPRGPWYGSPRFVLALLIASFALGFVLHLVRARSLRARLINAFEPLPFEQVLMVSDAGIAFESRWGSSLYRWNAVCAIHELPRHFGLVVKPGALIAIPRRAFASAEQAAEFAALVKSKANPAAA